MLSGMKESYKEGGSESTLTPCLADGVARRRSKRRQGHRRAGLLSFEKSARVHLRCHASAVVEIYGWKVAGLRRYG